MKNLIILFVLIFPMLGKSVDYVTGCRADINLEVDSAAIPLSTYTNGLAFWMDAAAGVYNAGATNFFIPDLSTNRNDATQTVANSQPTIIYSNGVWVCRTDGYDDHIDIPSITINSDTYFSIRARFVTTNNQYLVGQYNAVPKRYYVATSMDGVFGMGHGASYVSTVPADTDFHTFTISNKVMSIDGNIVATSTDSFAMSYPVKIGCQVNYYGATALYSNADIDWIIIK